MERSLRNRLIFGPIMLAALFALLWFDDWAQYKTRGWMESRYAAENFRGGVGGVGLMILLMLILPVATQELAILFTAERVRPYRILTIVGSAALVLHAFLTQFPPFRPIAASSLAFILAFIMLAAALRRALAKTPTEAIVKIA